MIKVFSLTSVKHVTYVIAFGLRVSGNSVSNTNHVWLVSGSTIYYLKIFQLETKQKINISISILEEIYYCCKVSEIFSFSDEIEL